MIMEMVWDASGPVTIRDVTEQLSGKQRLAFNTVMTVMNRLVEKGLLTRKGQKGSYTYRAAVRRDVFLQNITRAVATGLIRDFGGLAVTQFMEALDAHAPEALAELEAAVRRRKRAHDPR